HVPLGEQHECPLSQRPHDQRQERPAPPEHAQKDERAIQTEREPEAGPPSGRRHHQNALPYGLINGRLIASNQRPLLPYAGHSTPPPTRPKSPISVTPPPSNRRLRGRGYPRPLASELCVRVSNSHSSSME